MKDLYTNEEAKFINKQHDRAEEIKADRIVDVRKKIDDHLDSKETCYYEDMHDEVLKM